MSMHDGMCDNPLDMSNTKYTNRVASAQRDMNPLGYQLTKKSSFMAKHKKAKDMGFKQQNIMTKDGQDIFNKYQKWVDYSWSKTTN